jgi:long-chain acyl-CoA synthetase
VGPPLPGVEVRIAEDGEILTRGPHVMKGYWKEPEATARTIDAEGWLHTGDVGVLDSRGYLRITDRKKEILVTAQGKNVAPAPVENALKALPLVSQAALIGDRRPYVAALLVPDGEVVARRSGDLGMGGVADADRARHPPLTEAIREGVRGINARLDHHEQVRRFILLHREFSQQEGELTPTLKLKRRVIEKHFAREIEALYATHDDPRVIHV